MPLLDGSCYYWDEVAQVEVYCTCREVGCGRRPCHGGCGCEACDMAYEDFTGCGREREERGNG